MPAAAVSLLQLAPLHWSSLSYSLSYSWCGQFTAHALQITKNNWNDGNKCITMHVCSFILSLDMLCCLQHRVFPFLHARIDYSQHIYSRYKQNDQEMFLTLPDNQFLVSDPEDIFSLSISP